MKTHLIAEAIEALAQDVYEKTGNHGIKEVVVSTTLGFKLALSPGNHCELLTSVGPVTIRSEK